MTLVDVVSNKLGLACDRVLVRLTGYSFVTWVYNRASGVGYIDSLLLSTKGARSGRTRRAVLPYYLDRVDSPEPEGGGGGGSDHRYVLIGSNGGAKHDPHWVANLRRNADATVHVKRRRIAVRARVASGEERERLWNAITKGRGPYAWYQKQAAPREIPVVVLEPVAAKA